MENDRKWKVWNFFDRMKESKEIGPTINTGNPVQHVNLSLLSLECILPHLDANKRILLSLRQKQFAKFEKSVDFYIDELLITSSYVIINGLKYKFGEIHKIENADESLIEDLKRDTLNVENKNSRGGKGWKSQEDDILEEGDVTLGHRGRPLSEHQKFERIQKIRHIFMYALEKSIDDGKKFNPMILLENLLTDDGREWPIQLSDVIHRIHPGCRINIQQAFLEHQLLDTDMYVQPDQLIYQYPNAFREMARRIKEMDGLGDCRASVLRKLAFAPNVFPHFNQLTVFAQPGIAEYGNRIPDGLTLRHAFKKFISSILSGRKHIRVGTFQLYGHGIVPLPVGLKFDCIEVYSYELMHDKMGAIEKIVRKTESIFMSQPVIRQSTFFDFSLIHSCKKLQLCFFYHPFQLSQIQTLPKNDMICLCFNRCILEDFFLIFGNWANTPNRKIGSRLLLAYCRNFSSYEIHRALNSPLLLEMGFRKNNGTQSLYLPLNGNKYVELSLKNDKTHFSPNFFEFARFDYYFSLEILSGSPPPEVVPPVYRKFKDYIWPLVLTVYLTSVLRPSSKIFNF